jgi:AraC family transcriptional regulator, regulatory protein of adaptative response / DNA-3-methyladenine glycosylase II
MPVRPVGRPRRPTRPSPATDDRHVRFPLVESLEVRHDGGVLDPDHCYVAVQSRDPRFDGWFVTAVRTTGIYCRPSCPAITPKRANVDFFPTAAAAQQSGFRACKRCRPDASPGSPEWNTRQDVVARAMRLIADGEVERSGVPGLARRLGYSERHLVRMLTDELGAGPLAIARIQRAHTARLLVETTSMSVTDVAFAAGFGSVRQFNDTFRQVFATSPTAARRSTTSRPISPDGGVPGPGVTVRLPVRPPFAASDVMAFVGQRAIPGCEDWDGEVYRRSLDLAGGVGAVTVVAHTDHVSARFDLSAWSDLAAAVQRVRRLLDLDSDPVAVGAALSADPPMAKLVAAAPGRRAPASVDPFETAVRAIIGQQVSVAGARTVAARIVDAVGTPIEGERITRTFPAPEVLADAPDVAFSMPGSRRDTIRRLAAAVAEGSVELHVGADPDVVRAQLVALRGIGPWTADYVVMRGLGHPDTFLAGDLGVRHAMARLGLDDGGSTRWAPWRSYAVHHLWASLAPGPAPERKEPR